MVIIKIITFIIIFCLTLTYFPYQIDKYFRNRNMKKYNINIIKFYVTNVDLEKFNKSKKIILPEYYIKCNFSFEYKGKEYELDQVIFYVHNETESNYVCKGYKYLKEFNNKNDNEKLYDCYETIIKIVKRAIYEIDLKELKNEIEKEIKNEG